MTETKIHVCETCGGRLQIDTDRKLYLCPFCGITYDYAYFNEDELLEKAARFMERREFDAARDAYEFFLKKDPHNRETLKGMMLISNGIADITEMRNVKVLEDYGYDPSQTEWITGSADEDSKEYFRRMQEIFNNAGKYHKAFISGEDTEKDIKALEKRYGALDSGIIGNYYDIHNEKLGMTDYKHPKKMLRSNLLAVWGSIGGIGLLALIIGLISRSTVYMLVSIPWFAIAAVYTYVFYFFSYRPRMKGIKGLEATKERLQPEMEELLKKKKEITDEKNGYSREINNIIKELAE
ncbi:MAG: hypothetical protein J5685_08795 [Clostridiales bacterium]|nr:hypothetical protein [Clostridiales bacterium]